MQKQVLEARVLRLVSQVVDGGKIEDDLTECKREWPANASRAARQIGALANAAHGRDVAWLIGVDEDGHEVAPTGDTELADWWRSVESKFDGVAPELDSMLVDTPWGAVMMLQFRTDRAPYVVKVPQESSYVHREVPWRSGTSTATATRDQLLRLLVESTFTPEIELIDPSLQLIGNELRFRAELFLSMAATSQHPPLLPRRLWSVAVRSDAMDGQWLKMNPNLTRHVIKFGGRVILSRGGIDYKPDEYDPESPYGVYIRQAGLIVTGSDSVQLTASVNVEDPAGKDTPYYEIDVGLPIDRSDRVARAQCRLEWQQGYDGDEAPREFKGRWSQGD